MAGEITYIYYKCAHKKQNRYTLKKGGGGVILQIKIIPYLVVLVKLTLNNQNCWIFLKEINYSWIYLSTNVY